MWFTDIAFITSIFFKLVNFGLIVVLGIYVFKTYFLSSMKAQIKQKNLEEQKLINEIKALQKEQEDKKLQTRELNHVWERLYDNASRWHSLFEKEVEAFERSAREQEHQVRVRTEKQQEQVMIDAMRDTVLPQAIDQSAKQLSEFYGTEQGTQMIDNLLDFMQEKRS